MPLVGLAFTSAALKRLAAIPSKFRRQVTRRARELQSNPHPQGSKKLTGMTTETEADYRERSGDYRILYVVKQNPTEVIVLDIDNRKVCTDEGEGRAEA